jgi:hypothetical protein
MSEAVFQKQDLKVFTAGFGLLVSLGLDRLFLSDWIYQK